MQTKLYTLTLLSMLAGLVLAGCERKCDDKCQACFNECSKVTEKCKETYVKCRGNCSKGDESCLKTCAHQYKACEEGCLKKCAPPAQ